MTKKPEREILDAEYRVVGEGRWEPFKRWLREHYEPMFPAEFWTWNIWGRLGYLASLALIGYAFLAFVVWMNSRRY